MMVRVILIFLVSAVGFAPKGFARKDCARADAMSKAFDLKKLGLPTSLTVKSNKAQWPYHQPEDMQLFNRYSGFDVTSLAAGRRYIWVVDAAGTLRIARELQSNHNPAGHAFPQRDFLTHFDLMANHDRYPEHFRADAYDPSLQPARLGGELYIRESGGKVAVQLNVTSPYAVDPSPTQLSNVRNYLMYLSDIGNRPLSESDFIAWSAVQP